MTNGNSGVVGVGVGVDDAPLGIIFTTRMGILKTTKCQILRFSVPTVIHTFMISRLNKKLKMTLETFYLGNTPEETRFSNFLSFKRLIFELW
jgi:hypothetical protein